MKNLVIAAAFCLVGLVPQATANSLYIDDLDASGNSVELSVLGQDNLISITQQLIPGGQGLSTPNVLRLSITGDGNGEGANVDLSNSFFSGDVTSGSLLQSGSGNMIELSVLGSNNLFAFAQTGHNNTAFGSMTGHANMANVQQMGNNNVAAFSQNGNGNMINISQKSW
jgi:hypothetical protein